MRFNSIVFVVFLIAVVAVLWTLPPRARKAWLIATSYAFYGTWRITYLPLLVGIGVLAHYGGAWVLAADDAQRKRRGWIVGGALLAVLGTFKYTAFLLENVNAIAALVRAGERLVPLPRWILPLGLSFYVFEAVSYVVECTRKKEKQYSFWDFQLFVSFFPHLMAGPILRAKELIPQFAREKWKLATEDLTQGLWLLASGLLVKVVLADGMATSVDRYYAADPSTFGTPDVVVMAVSFGLQIYLDFSAYSRIALGAGRLCGVKLVENFNYPFAAEHPADFWNRWHMSLSRWIRDYVFFPLVGKRLTVSAMCKASLVAMTVCGIWHGAGWTFVLWGFYHGVLVAGYYVARAVTRKKDEKDRPLPNWFDTRAGTLVSMAITWVLLLPGWILFRANTMKEAGRLLATLATPWAHRGRTIEGRFYLEVAVLMCAVWVAPIVDAQLDRVGKSLAKNRPTMTPYALASIRGAAVAVLLAAVAIYLDAQTSFIYFQF